MSARSQEEELDALRGDTVEESDEGGFDWGSSFGWLRFSCDGS